MADSTTPDPRSLNLYQKLAAITAEIGVVEKGGKNSEQHYNFIEYAAVAGKLRTLFGKYGVVIVPRMAKAGDQNRADITSSYGKRGVAVLIDFEFDVRNADKPDDFFIVTWTGEAADYGDKATNKAATSALKYYQMRQFNISEKGDDPDQDSPDRGDISTAPAPEHKPVTIQDAVARAAAELTRKGFDSAEKRKQVMAAIAGIEDLKELQPSHVAHIIKVVESTSGHDLQGYLDVDVTEEVPSEEPSGEPLSAQAQTLLLGWAKQASGLADRADVIAFIEEEVGKPLAQLTHADLTALKKRFKSGGDEGSAS